MQKRFEYILHLAEGESQSFVLEVDPVSLVIRDDDSVPGPDWTLLEYEKCTHCPYNAGDKKYCPVAKNLAHAASSFREERSFKKLMAFVKSEERVYGKNTDLQTALFSLFGLIMASSSCSHLQMFKPMARYHLPFSSAEETAVRAIGMHLISEYLKSLEIPGHVVNLDGLLAKYEKVSLVNQGIIKRIRSLKGGDATQNALIALDGFASLLPIEISTGLNELKAHFS